jgi:hypothetical protein
MGISRGLIRSLNDEIGIDPLRREEEFGFLSEGRPMTKCPKDVWSDYRPEIML